MSQRCDPATEARARRVGVQGLTIFLVLILQGCTFSIRNGVTFDGINKPSDPATAAVSPVSPTSSHVASRTIVPWGSRPLIDWYARRAGVTQQNSAFLNDFARLTNCNKMIAHASNEIRAADDLNTAYLQIRGSGHPTRLAIEIYVQLGQYDPVKHEFPLLFPLMPRYLLKDMVTLEGMSLFGTGTRYKSCVAETNQRRRSDLHPTSLLVVMSHCHEDRNEGDGNCGTVPPDANTVPLAQRRIPQSMLLEIESAAPWGNLPMPPAEASELIEKLHGNNMASNNDKNERYLLGELVYDLLDPEHPTGMPNYFRVRPVALFLWGDMNREVFLGALGNVKASVLVSPERLPLHANNEQAWEISKKWENLNAPPDSFVPEDLVLALAQTPPVAKGGGSSPSNAATITTVPTATVTPAVPCPANLPNDADLTECGYQVKLQNSGFYKRKGGTLGTLPEETADTSIARSPAKKTTPDAAGGADNGDDKTKLKPKVLAPVQP